MTQREVYQLFTEWFDSVEFAGMTDGEKDKLWEFFYQKAKKENGKVC